MSAKNKFFYGLLILFFAGLFFSFTQKTYASASCSASVSPIEVQPDVSGVQHSFTITNSGDVKNLKRR
ncbi:MAG: hypothetical protein COU25_02600 [Candidatus Levybacteria bacterium CG10_big_fil_rev_8_21_14_0_10_35_13]|nr:MAG: hypothetical protein COU25_02600 [Candidatus Levybacteria bacterium CG10_big_fil_rev_8_21_14_0_10_35_13]